MRKLSLRKESLTELTTDELAVVVGAAETKICVTHRCITPASLTECLPTNGCG
ncbi:MAG TPA: class I lanthipeptide [Frankiaceae bacterium]|nr:class I lanthipeptide [Frankiaceae bacterium]